VFSVHSFVRSVLQGDYPNFATLEDVRSRDNFTLKGYAPATSASAGWANTLLYFSSQFSLCDAPGCKFHFPGATPYTFNTKFQPIVPNFEDLQCNASTSWLDPTGTPCCDMGYQCLNRAWDASMALGPANAALSGYDAKVAWTHSQESAGYEVLEVEFGTPIYIRTWRVIGVEVGIGVGAEGCVRERERREGCAQKVTNTLPAVICVGTVCLRELSKTTYATSSSTLMFTPPRLSASLDFQAR